MATLNRRRESPTVHRQGSNFRPFYQSARWHRLSTAHRKANPLCQRCLDKGITERGEVTDHIVPLVIWVDRLNQDPYNHINLQTLSKRCHSIKTKEDAQRKEWKTIVNSILNKAA